jgi:hypothetical protein
MCCDVPYVVSYVVFGNMLGNIFKDLKTHLEVQGTPQEPFENLVKMFWKQKYPKKSKPRNQIWNHLQN